MTTKLEEYTERWASLRNELWAIEEREKAIKKELVLLEAWMTGLEHEPKKVVTDQEIT